MARVKFGQAMPKIYELCEGPNRSLIMVYASHGTGVVDCLILRGRGELGADEEITATGEIMQVPAGNATLGRVMDAFGEPIDELGEIAGDKVSVIGQPPKYPEIEAKEAIWETGIKVIDLVAPLIQGGKTGLFGGALGLDWDHAVGGWVPTDFG